MLKIAVAANAAFVVVAAAVDVAVVAVTVDLPVHLVVLDLVLVAAAALAAVLDLFQQRDTETLLNIAQRILYDAIQICAPEYLDQIEKPAGYRIPGWDAKPQK